MSTAPFQSHIIDSVSNFPNETDGVWHFADWDQDGLPDLVFIKTANTQSGKVEVHISSGASNFQTRILDIATVFAPETDGHWLLYDTDGDGKPDLVFIKTANTPSGRVEIHIASGKSNFAAKILETATTYTCEPDGVWQLADWNHDGSADLVFIKPPSVPNSTVQVYIASAKSNYQTRILATGSTFISETDGTWLLRDVDGDGKPDLVLIKTANTPSGHVEVHVASGVSNFATRILEVPTIFANETDGTWHMVSTQRNKLSDLAFVKTANTPSGRVEVHVAPGWTSPQMAASAAAAAAVAAAQDLMLANSVNGIRVHNTGAFTMSFSVGGGPNGQTTSPTNMFETGGNATISTHNGGLHVPDGSQIYPIAHIQYGSSNHGAGHNVTFNQASKLTAVYNCSGGCDTPSFSFQENSSDGASDSFTIGSGGSGYGGGSGVDNSGLHNAGGILRTIDQGAEEE